MPRSRVILGPLLTGLFLVGSGASAWAATPGEGAAPSAKPAAPKPAAKAPAPAKTAEAKPLPAKAPESKSSDKLAEAKALPKATETKAADPTRGAPTRRVPEPEAPKPEAKKSTAVESAPSKLEKTPPPEQAKPDTKVTQKEPAKPATHQKGKPPRKPAATLPAGVAKPAPDTDARRQIAAGPTGDDVRAGKDDPELRALREAERVLFPRALPGFTPGWSWDLPRPVTSGGPEVQASGLPPGLPLAGASQPAGAELEWVKRLSLPDLPVRWDERVIKYLKFYRDSPSGRAVAKVWAKKSGKYVKALRAELVKTGLPSDLVWLSLIESGHNPTIVSPAGAVGLWQFMPDAGRTYGLTVDRWVDERLDPERATEAAARYLGDLYRRFGSWELAMAAYNMGYGGLNRAIRKFSSNDFWELARHEAGIPWETTLYVPKIVATAIMMNNPAAFGIADIQPEPPQSFDSVMVGPGTPLDAVASAAGVPVETIQALNPQYLAGRTPPSAPGQRAQSYRVRVPAGRGAAATKALARAPSHLDGVVTYVVRAGDTAQTIAASAGTSETKIRSLNRVGPQEVLAAGTILLVPQRERATAELASSAEEVVIVSRQVPTPPEHERLFYRVLSGDTLGKIAAALSVTRHELLAWNAIDESARLVPGMTLQVFVKRGGAPRARCLSEREARVLVAGTPEFFDYYEGLNGKKRIVVAAKEGDTLAGIGRRYGMTVGWMERVNRRSRSDKLEPGERLVVYTDRPATGTVVSEVAVAQLSEPVPPLPGVLPGSETLAAEEAREASDAPASAPPRPAVP